MINWNIVIFVTGFAFYSIILYAYSYYLGVKKGIKTYDQHLEKVLKHISNAQCRMREKHIENAEN